MSNVVTTTISTKDGTTDLVLQSGNTSGPAITIQSTGGNVAFSNVSFLTIGGVAVGPVINTQTFAASGTWTKPAGVNYALVECWGGGGGGATRAGSCGGGGGAYVGWLCSVANLSSSHTVTVGLGGANTAVNLAAGDGGTTTFGTLVTAYGGAGGGATTNKQPGGSPFGATPASGMQPNTLGLCFFSTATFCTGISGNASAAAGGDGILGFGGGGGAQIWKGGDSYGGGGAGGGGGSTTSAAGNNGVAFTGLPFGAVGGNGGHCGNNTVAATNGSVPGGGGGGENGTKAGTSGGNGQCIVRCW